MAAEVKTTLRIVTDEYKKKLNESKKQMQDFEKMTKFASGTVLKFMGALGAGATVFEGLNKAINSSQTLSDEYNRTMDGLKGSVDNLFYSLANGDWSPFLQGLNNSIMLAREAYTALDQLGNTTMSYGYFNAKNQAGLQQQIAILRDKTSTDEQKKLAKAEADRILADQKEITEQLSRRTNEALTALIRKSTGLSGLDISQVDLEKSLRLDVSLLGDEEKEILSKQYKDFQKKSNELRSKYTKQESVYLGTAGFGIQEKLDVKSFDEALKSILPTYLDAIMYNSTLVKESDDWLQNVISLKHASFAAEQSYASMQKTANRTTQKDIVTPKTTKENKEVLVAGSIGAINAEISQLQKKYEQAADDGTRIGLYKAIQDAQKKLDRMLFASSIKTIDAPSFSKKRGKTTSDALKDKIKPIVNSEDIKTTQNYNDALYGTLNVMQAIGSVTNESATGWISYGVNCVTALGNTYQALQKVIPALMVKATVEASGSAAQTPIVGWIAAIAAIGSMVAAFATLPKYETGGIISGTSYRGDNILVRANSGELILNRAQQRNIAHQLTSGGATRVDVNVTGRISGRDLEFVIDKRKRYNERTR